MNNGGIQFAFKNGKSRIKNSDLSSRRGSLREFRRKDQPLRTCRSEFAEDTVVRASAGGGAGPCGAEMSQGVGISVSPIVLLSVLSVSSRPAEDAFRAAETRCSPPHRTAADCRSSINGMNNLRCVERITVSALRKIGKKNGRRMRRRKRGRELVRVAF